MASVTFPEELGGNGQTYTDDADPTTGLDGLGYTIRFIPCLKQAVSMGLSAKNDAVAAASFVQQCQTLSQEAATDRQAVAEDRAAVEEHLQDAQVRIGTTQALIDARDTALGAQAGAEDAETGAVTAQAGAEAARDAAVVSGQVYPGTSAGLTATSDGQYFKTVAANQAGFLTLWRNDAGVATEIETYPSLTGIAQALQQANRRQTRLARSLQRLGDHGQTLHSDFNLNAYGLGTPRFGGVQDAFETAEGIWETERLSGTLAYQHVADGSLKYVYVPPDVIAREYSTATGRYQSQLSPTIENMLLRSCEFDAAVWAKGTLSVTGSSLDTAIEGELSYRVLSTSAAATQVLYGAANVTENTEYTFSVVVKNNGGDLLKFRAYDNTAGADIAVLDVTSQIENERFNRLAMTVNTPAGCTDMYIYPAYKRAADGSAIIDVLLNHAQLVEGNSPGPVIITGGAPVTRAADNVNRALGEEFSAIEWTCVYEFEYPGYTPGISHCMSLSGSAENSSASPRCSIRMDGADWRCSLADNSGVQFFVTRSSLPLFSIGINKLGYSRKGSDFLLALNGEVVAVSGVPDGADFSNFSHQHLTSTFSNPAFNHVVSELYTNGLNATQLQERTAL